MKKILVRTERGRLTLETNKAVTGFDLVTALAHVFGYSSVLKNKDYYGQLCNWNDEEVMLSQPVPGGEYRFEAFASNDPE